jgi:hypothetical protein
MQRYTIFFIIVTALHVSGGFSVHHQELKNCIHTIWYVPGLLAATAGGDGKQESKRQENKQTNFPAIFPLIIRHK